MDAQAANLHVEVGEDSDVETQQSLQHYHAYPSMSMPSTKVSNHPHKLFCRKLSTKVYHFLTCSLLLSISTPFLQFLHAIPANLYVPQASVSYRHHLQNGTTDTSAMKKRPRGRPRKNLEESGEVKKEGKEKFNKKYARWDNKFSLAHIYVRGEMQDEFTMPPKQC